MRKEKSRDAARSRRGKENYEFYELAKMLPLPNAITTQLDKASIVRLTMSYLKVRDFCVHGDPPWSPGTEICCSQKPGKVIPIQDSATEHALQNVESNVGSHILQSLDGFLFALGTDGRFLYISETVSIYLGLSQVEMTGNSIFDYVHSSNHSEIADYLGIKLPYHDGAETSSSSTNKNAKSTCYGLERTFFIQMKSTLTKRGVHIKSSGYKVIHVTGRMRPRVPLFPGQRQPPTMLGMVAIGHSLPSPTMCELPVESFMFFTKMSLDFKIKFCEYRVCSYMNLTPSDLEDKSLYHICHGGDVQSVAKCHSELLKKGQAVSDYYRLLNRNGGYVWIQTIISVACNAKAASSDTAICINYVVSKIERKNCALDTMQLCTSGVGQTVSESLEINTEIEETSIIQPDHSNDIPSHSKSPLEAAELTQVTKSPPIKRQIESVDTGDVIPAKRLGLPDDEHISYNNDTGSLLLKSDNKSMRTGTVDETDVIQCSDKPVSNIINQTEHSPVYQSSISSSDAMTQSSVAVIGLDSNRNIIQHCNDNVSSVNSMSGVNRRKNIQRLETFNNVRQSGSQNDLNDFVPVPTVEPLDMSLTMSPRATESLYIPGSNMTVYARTPETRDSSNIDQWEYGISDRDIIHDPRQSRLPYVGDQLSLQSSMFASSNPSRLFLSAPHHSSHFHPGSFSSNVVNSSYISPHGSFSSFDKSSAFSSSAYDKSATSMFSSMDLLSPTQTFSSHTQRLPAMELLLNSQSRPNTTSVIHGQPVGYNTFGGGHLNGMGQSASDFNRRPEYAYCQVIQPNHNIWQGKTTHSLGYAGLTHQDVPM